MKDNDLIVIFRSKISEALAKANWNFPVIQLEQPTLQGANTDSTVYFQKLFDVPYGTAQRTKQWDAANNVFNDTEEQAYETTFKVSALIPQVPGDLSIPTPSDVVNYIQKYLSHRAIIAQMNKLGFRILRVTRVTNPYFTDDKSLMEAMPSFDIVITHSQSLTLTIPKIDRIEGKAYPV